MHAEGGPSAAPRSRMNGVARQQGQRYAMTLPLMAPGILASAVIAFAAGLGEFGAVITFASSIPGQTQTLPLAIYAAIQAPGGEATAAKLSLVSFTLAVAGLPLPEVIARQMRSCWGRSGLPAGHLRPGEDGHGVLAGKADQGDAVMARPLHPQRGRGGDRNQRAGA